MAFSLSIDEMLRGRPRSALESMQQQQAFDQNRQKLAALIQQTQLANQTSQLKMPYVAPKAAADIKELLAKAAYQQQEANYVPAKYNIQQQNANTSSNNYNLQREINSPQMIQAVLNARIAKAQRDASLSDPNRVKLQDAYKQAMINNLNGQNSNVNDEGFDINSNPGGPQTSGTDMQSNGPPLRMSNNNVGGTPPPQLPAGNFTGSEPQVSLPDGQWVGLKAGKTRSGGFKFYKNNVTGETRQVLTEPVRTQIFKQKMGFQSVLSMLDSLEREGKSGILGFRFPNGQAKYKAIQNIVQDPSMMAVQTPKVQEAFNRIDDIFGRQKYTTQKEYVEQLQLVKNALKKGAKVTNDMFRHNAITIPPDKNSKYYPNYLNKIKRETESAGKFKIPKFQNQKMEHDWFRKLNRNQQEGYLEYSSKVHGEGE